MVSVLLLGVLAAQDAVEVKTNDGLGTPQVRFSVTSGATTADVWVRRSRLRFDVGAGTEGFLNVSSSASGTPAAGDFRYSAGSLLYYNGTGWLTVTTNASTGSGYVLLGPAAVQTESGAVASIFLNDTGGGNLLHLQSGGFDRLVVSNTGVISSATWSGTAIGAVYGGTGQTAVVTGDLLYGSVANTWSRLAGPAGAGQYVRSTGVNAFAWSTIPSGDVPSGSSYYIQNQNAVSQAADFRISGAGRIDSSLTVGGAYSNVYATLIYGTGGNFHVQGNEDASGQPIGTRTRLRVGNAWGFPGLYAETNSNATAQQLVLGASSALVTIGPGGATVMNFQVPNGTITVADTVRHASDVDGASRLNFYHNTNSSDSRSWIELWGNDTASGRTGELTLAGSYIDFRTDGNTTDAGTVRMRLTNSGILTVGSPTVGANSYFTETWDDGSATGFTWSNFANYTNETNGAASTSGSDVVIRSETVGVASSTAWIQITLNCTVAGGWIAFNFRVSSEASFDFLRFFIDGVQQAAWSGTVGWQQAVFTIAAAGSHTFRWEYTKDGIVNSGDDRAYIDTILVNSVSNDQGAGTIIATNRIFANTSAMIGDVAEYMPVADLSDAGSIVFVGTDGKIRASVKPFDASMLGVVSEAPSVLINNPKEGSPIGLVGRVKVKVCDEGGAIRHGDAITTSSQKGTGMKATRAGPIVGLALETFEGKSGKVLVMLQVGRWYVPEGTEKEKPRGAEPKPTEDQKRADEKQLEARKKGIRAVQDNLEGTKYKGVVPKESK